MRMQSHGVWSFLVNEKVGDESTPVWEIEGDYGGEDGGGELG